MSTSLGELRRVPLSDLWKHEEIDFTPWLAREENIARLSSAVDDDDFFQAQDFLGGFLNLSGFEERALFGNQSALARAVLYRRTGNTSRLFSLPMYVGGSLETGNTWTTRDAVDGGDLIVAGSLFTGFDTPLGPMFLAYGRNEEDEASWYLTFGSLLRPRVK